jgi:hypothetical protein
MNEQLVTEVENQAIEQTEATSQYLIPTIEELTKKGINESIAAAFVGMDYDGLRKAIDDVIAEEIEKRITANIPKSKQVDDFNSQLKAFESMGYKDRLELSKKNPRLYRELTAKVLA